MENEEMLSIGTIVKLKDAKKLAMIVGFSMVDSTDENKVKIYDYLGCVYPQGIFNGDFNIYFNSGDIEEVVFKGYSNEDDKKFKTAHKKMMEEMTPFINKEDDGGEVL